MTSTRCRRPDRTNTPEETGNRRHAAPLPHLSWLCTMVMLVGLYNACTPSIREGQFQCEPNTPGACPPGWVCLEWKNEHRCFLHGQPDCGNGRIDPGEQCDAADFGNRTCVDFLGEPGVMVCLTDCTVHCTTCGNGLVEMTPSGVGEECDDGNQAAGDGCSPLCTIERCGNANVDPGEDCDDGNSMSGDGCSPACRLEKCGNTIVDYGVGEECDDGNLRSRDGCSSICTVETPLWTEWESPMSRGRRSHGMAYDQARERIVIFSGANATGQPSDTWEWDGARWLNPLPPHSPPPRNNAAMAYHAGLQRTVLFGGFGGFGGSDALGDTWEFDGRDWEVVATPSALTARHAVTMVYDVAGDRLLLFGGETNGSPHSDTWSYDASGWTLLNPATSPPGRWEHTMAYDSVRQRVVVFGGADGATQLNDTWEFDGDNWAVISTPVSPSVRGWSSACFNPLTNRVVLIGGWHTPDVLSDVWEYDGASWVQVTPGLDSLRAGHRMAFDSARGRLVLYGGQYLEYMSDIWEHDGSNWQEVSPNLGSEPSIRGAITYDVTRGVGVIFGGWNLDGLQNDTWEFDGQQWREVAIPVSPPPRQEHALAFDRARGKVVLFGGYDGAAAYGDTWTFDGDSWTPVFTTSPPSPRLGHAMTYDASNQRVVLFGGNQLSDTWAFAGDQWVELMPDVAPSPRRHPGMIYDAARGRIVMFGGWKQPATGYLNDTWEFDGATWERVYTRDAPSVRDSPVMVYDPSRERVLLFGGKATYGGSAEAGLGDLWEYDGHNWTLLSPAAGPSPKQLALGYFDSQLRALVLTGGIPGPDETWLFTFGGLWPNEVCDNGLDDDGDALQDCDDPDCNLASDCAPIESSMGGLDADGDGLVGCADPNCGGLLCGAHGMVCADGACQCLAGIVERSCGDGLDNDCDGKVDCLDADCVQDEYCGGGGQCAGWTPIACDDIVNATTEGGPENVVDYSCSEWPATGPEKIFRLDTFSARGVTITLSEAAVDLDLLVVGADNDLSCDPVDACIVASPTTGDEQVSWITEPGESYFVIVDGFNRNAGTFHLEVACQ